MAVNAFLWIGKRISYNYKKIQRLQKNILANGILLMPDSNRRFEAIAPPSKTKVMGRIKRLHYELINFI